MTKTIIPNYLLMTGPQDGPYALEGFYTAEADSSGNSLMDAVQRAEERGEFCFAFALETPHYVTADPEDSSHAETEPAD